MISPTPERLARAFARKVGGSHCPYIGAAFERGVLHFTHHKVEDARMACAQAEVFYWGVLHSESLRLKREALPPTAAALYCHNAVFTLPAELKNSGGEVLGWPHWLLKLLYVPVGVMFGKFWRGQEQDSTSGEAVPVPPVTFLSIRSAVPHVDANRFFGETPDLRDVLRHSDDDGRNVHLGPSPAGRDLRLLAMRRDGYYWDVLAWGLDHHGDMLSASARSAGAHMLASSDECRTP